MEGSDNGTETGRVIAVKADMLPGTSDAVWAEVADDLLFAELLSLEAATGRTGETVTPLQSLRAHYGQIEWEQKFQQPHPDAHSLWNQAAAARANVAPVAAAAEESPVDSDNSRGQQLEEHRDAALRAAAVIEKKIKE